MHAQHHTGLSAEQAEAFGRQDGSYVVGLAELVTLKSPQDFALLVNGDHLSPSWRALPNGEQVFQSGDLEAVEAYEYEVEQAIGSYSANGASIGWSDGALWLWGREFDCEGL